jgi:hypothetical protein
VVQAALTTSLPDLPARFNSYRRYADRVFASEREGLDARARGLPSFAFQCLLALAVASAVSYLKPPAADRKWNRCAKGGGRRAPQATRKFLRIPDAGRDRSFGERDSPNGALGYLTGPGRGLRQCDPPSSASLVDEILVQIEVQDRPPSLGHLGPVLGALLKVVI